MKKLLIYAGLLITAALPACNKDIQEEDSDLTGNWEWVRTDGGIANHIHETPATTGNTVSLQFKQNHGYARYVNGILQQEGTYQLQTAKCIHDQLSKPVIVGNPALPPMMIESFRNDSLFLSDEANDGMLSVYVKK